MPQPASAFAEGSLALLGRALHDRDSDLRNVQLATVSPEGLPELRTVVLRGFDHRAATAELHTDTRARKAGDIAANAAVALLAWSARDRLQLRFSGTATLHRADGLARARWDALSPGGRQPYGYVADPGSAIADPTVQPHLPPDAQFEHFAAMVVALGRFDILQLGSGGRQTRAAGRFTGDGVVAEWVGA